MSDATREVYWNISHIWLMYVLLIPSLAICGYGVYRRARKWRRGKPLVRHDRPWQRLRRVVQHAILHQATWRDRFVGALHAMIFWGFITLAVATTVVFVHHDFSLPIMQGRFYLYFQSFFVDCLGMLAMMKDANPDDPVP